MFLRLCGPPSIPLSFTVAGVLLLLDELLHGVLNAGLLLGLGVDEVEESSKRGTTMLVILPARAPGSLK